MFGMDITADFAGKVAGVTLCPYIRKLFQFSGYLYLWL